MKRRFLKLLTLVVAFTTLGGCGNKNTANMLPSETESSTSGKQRVFVATTSVYRDDKNNYSSTVNYQLDANGNIQKKQEESTFHETPSVWEYYYLSGNIANKMSEYYENVVHLSRSNEVLLDNQVKLKEQLISEIGTSETSITLFVIKDGMPQYMQLGSDMDSFSRKIYNGHRNEIEYGGYTFNSLGLYKHREQQFFYDESGKEIGYDCAYNEGKAKLGAEYTYDLDGNLVQQRNIEYTDIGENTTGYVKYTYDQNGNRIMADGYDDNWNPTGITSKYIRDKHGNLSEVQNYQNNIMYEWTQYIYTEVYIPEDRIPFLTAVYDWCGIPYNIS